MRTRRFRTVLRTQIVVPLLVVSTIVAVLTAVFGIYRLSGIIDAWYERDATHAIESVRAVLADDATSLTSVARSVARDPQVALALSKDDPAPVRAALEAMLPGSGADCLMVIDDRGVVVASTSQAPLGTGGRVAPRIASASREATAGFATFLGGSTSTERIAGVAAVPGWAARRSVIALAVIDQPFLKRAFGAQMLSVTLSDADGRPLARYLGADPALGAPDQASVASQTYLARNLAPDSTVTKASIADMTSTSWFNSYGQHYAVRSTRLSFRGVDSPHSGHAALRTDPSGETRLATIVIGNRAASEAGRTGTILITVWSMAATLVLASLGAVMARRVSDPLAVIAESARRVASGDFDAHVSLQGAREVVELGEAFNGMTESLRERTESLTKKLLELATLYEMSRVLSATLDLDTLLDSVLDSALRIFDADSGYGMLRDHDTGKLELRSWRTSVSERLGSPAERSSMSEWVAQHARPLIFNPPAEAAPGAHVDAITGAVAALCVPLMSADGVIGTLAVGSHDPAHRFTADDVRLLSTIANHVTMAVGNVELFSSLQDAYLATVRSLAAAVDAKDPYTRGHSDRVAAYAGAIATRLGMSGEQCIALEMAAYLHDIGKIGIGEDILLKPGPLDADETRVMRHHPLIGANILRPVAFPWPIAPVVRHHHERFDGTGYPAGLRGEEIPMLARVLTAADAYEAMTADRPYRRGRTMAEAIAELRRCSGSQFDPQVVDVFVEELHEQHAAGAGGTSERAIEHVPAEARAIFVAIADGMISSYLTLGGPRLASNLEAGLNAWFEETGLPFSLSGGHLSAEWGPADGTAELDDMRAVIARLSLEMGETTGPSLVDHFYNEAVDDLSVRMRGIASVLDLYPRA